MLRVSARIAPSVNSATAEALRPGVLTTVTPRARAAAMSMLTGPPRDTATSFSPGIRSNIAADSGARCVTRTPAAPTWPTT
jgi:hypothetical protein